MFLSSATFGNASRPGEFDVMSNDVPADRKPRFRKTYEIPKAPSGPGTVREAAGKNGPAVQIGRAHV